MSEQSEVDPFEIAAFQCKASLALAKRVAALSPSGFFDEDEVWFYAQAFGSAFTAVMDAVDNLAKQHGQAVILIVETWKNQNRQDYFDLAASVRNRMQHGGLQLGLRCMWIDEEDHMNDTVHRVRKYYFAEITRKGQPASWSRLVSGQFIFSSGGRDRSINSAVFCPVQRHGMILQKKASGDRSSMES